MKDLRENGFFVSLIIHKFLFNKPINGASYTAIFERTKRESAIGASGTSSLDEFWRQI